MTDAPRLDHADLLYGVPAIAAFLGLRVRQARHRIAENQIPSFKIGGTICASRKVLTEWLFQRAAEEEERLRSSKAGDNG